MHKPEVPIHPCLLRQAGSRRVLHNSPLLLGSGFSHCKKSPSILLNKAHHIPILTIFAKNWVCPSLLMSSYPAVFSVEWRDQRSRKFNSSLIIYNLSLQRCPTPIQATYPPDTVSASNTAPSPTIPSISPSR